MADKQEDYLEYQSKALDYLYDIMPAANDSLFIATFFTGKDVSIGNASYRIKSISIPTPQISMDWDDGYKTSIIKKIENHDEVTIEWYEDAFNSVQNYHLQTMSNIANLQTGVFTKGFQGIYKIIITKFRYTEGNSKAETPFDSMPMPEKVGTIELNLLIPINVGDIQYDSSSGGDMKTVSITYKVNTIVMSKTLSAAAIHSNDFPGSEAMNLL